jgi:hypothetical protein
LLRNGPHVCCGYATTHGVVAPLHPHFAGMMILRTGDIAEDHLCDLVVQCIAHYGSPELALTAHQKKVVKASLIRKRAACHYPKRCPKG